MTEQYNALTPQEIKIIIAQISDLMRIDEFTFNEIQWLIERGIDRGILTYSYGGETALTDVNAGEQINNFQTT